MKLCLVVGALAAALGAVGCGGNGGIAVGGCDRDDPTCPTSSSGSGASVSPGGSARDDAGSAAGDAGANDAAATGVDGAGRIVDAASGGVDASGGGVDAASGGPGACVPGAACGGLWACNDSCYSDKCCYLDCTCTDSSGQGGNLECSLQCP
jgi:hypothetical protein